MRLSPLIAAGAAVIVGLGGGAAWGQRTDVFVASRDHPAIAYTTAPVNDAIADLNRKIDEGSVRLVFDRATGYLRSTLEALGIPIESQSLVFSETSSQAAQINPRNPRAVFFNDIVSVGWVRGGELLELAAQDPRQGVIFYTLQQAAAGKPRLKRDNGCLLCHITWDTLGVPGLQVLSTFQMSDDPNAYASGFVANHNSPLNQRWGGWYVTGKVGSVQHLGNVPVIVKAEELKKKAGLTPQLESVEGRFDTTGFPTPYSDVAALMVLEHQTHMTNLITRVGWEARVASFDLRTAGAPPGRAQADAGGTPARVGQAAHDLVDYLLFIDEAPLSGKVQGTSGFAEKFSAQGPRDSRGRSLRQLDLERRMMRYPCSYMIYTAAFDALPPLAIDAVYQRMWQILSGKETQGQYARLSLADRRAVVEILRDTKKGLPSYFQEVMR